jgi:periplasmic divalent cation tolerance protein
MAAAETLLVFTSMPDRESAERLARVLVERRLAACVNILAPCSSVYSWKGAVETADEHPMLIKTTRDRYAALEARIRSGHSYELPEIIAVPVAAGLPDYLLWVHAQTRPDDQDQ